MLLVAFRYALVDCGCLGFFLHLSRVSHVYRVSLIVRMRLSCYPPPAPSFRRYLRIVCHSGMVQKLAKGPLNVF